MNGCATVIGTLVAVIAGVGSCITTVSVIALGIGAGGGFALLVAGRGVRGLAAD